MITTTGPFGRLTDSILNLDYGDEQERLRYYETYAIVVHLQLIALPIVGAVVIAVTGSAAAGPVILMIGAAFSLILLGLVHLQRHNVPTESIAMSERNRGYMVVYGLSCLTLVLACIARGGSSGLPRGFEIGAMVGLVLGFAAVAFAIRQHRDDEVSTDPEA